MKKKAEYNETLLKSYLDKIRRKGIDAYVPVEPGKALHMDIHIQAKTAEEASKISSLISSDFPVSKSFKGGSKLHHAWKGGKKTAVIGVTVSNKKESRRELLNKIAKIKLEDIEFIHKSPHLNKVLEPVSYKNVAKERSSTYMLKRKKTEEKYRKLLGHEDRKKSYLYATIPEYSKMRKAEDYPGYSHYFKLSPKQMEEALFEVAHMGDKKMKPMKGKKGLKKAIKIWKKHSKDYKSIEREGKKYHPRIEVVIPGSVKVDSYLEQVEDRKTLKRKLFKKAAKDLYVYSAIPKDSKKLIKEHGLLAGTEVLKNKKVLKEIRPDKKERDLWIKSIKRRLKKGTWLESYQGPNVFFTKPDAEKIHSKHKINTWDLEPIKINLTKLMKDKPETKIWGMELSPFDEKRPDTWKDRHAYLSNKQIKDYSKINPKELWKHYDSPEGTKYASNVPHGALITPDGKIDPKYIDFDQEWDWKKKAEIDKEARLLEKIAGKRAQYTPEQLQMLREYAEEVYYGGVPNWDSPKNRDIPSLHIGMQRKRSLQNPGMLGTLVRGVDKITPSFTQISPEELAQLQQKHMSAAQTWASGLRKRAEILEGDELKKARLQKLREARENGGRVKSLKEVLKMKNFKIKIDRPIGKYRGGKDWAGMVYPVNYGEIPNVINPSDGDPWDVIVPGPVTPKKTLKVRKIIGYVPLSDGNHKLIGTYKAKTRINLKQIMEFVKRRRRQAIKNNSEHTVKNPVIIP